MSSNSADFVTFKKREMRVVDTYKWSRKARFDVLML